MGWRSPPISPWRTRYPASDIGDRVWLAGVVQGVSQEIGLFRMPDYAPLPCLAMSNSVFPRGAQPFTLTALTGSSPAGNRDFIETSELGYLAQAPARPSAEPPSPPSPPSPPPLAKPA